MERLKAKPIPYREDQRKSAVTMAQRVTRQGGVGPSVPTLRRSLGYTSQIPGEPESFSGGLTAHLVLNHTAAARAWGPDRADRHSALRGKGEQTERQS